MVKRSSHTLQDTLLWLKEEEIDEIILPKSQDRRTSSAPDTKSSVKSPSIAFDHAEKSFSSLEELKEAYCSLTTCPLKNTATNFVFSDGNPKASIMLLGEAPGAEEDLAGKPFVGQSGQLLDRIFEAAGLLRARDLYITNMVAWRPPGNRQPTPQEITACWPFVAQHIKLINPRVIICVGSIATKALLKTDEGITKIHGKWFDYEGKKVMPIYHPAFLLRSPSRKKEVWFDVLQLLEPEVWNKPHQ